MSREIKFRAWLPDDKRMIPWNRLWLELEDGYGGVSEFFPKKGEHGEHGPTTSDFKLMQYTGLKDKNGKEIYEGDIISTDLDRPFNIVVFRNGAFMFQCHDNGKDYYDYMFSVDEESDQWKFGEVIGNVWEHPHLLK